MSSIKEHAWPTDGLPGWLIAPLKMCKDGNCNAGHSYCASYCASSGSCSLKMWGRISCKGILPLYSSIPDHCLVLIWQGCECACVSSNWEAKLCGHFCVSSNYNSQLLSNRIFHICIFLQCEYDGHFCVSSNYNSQLLSNHIFHICIVHQCEYDCASSNRNPEVSSNHTFHI